MKPVLIPFGDSMFDERVERFFEVMDELFSRRSVVMGVLAGQLATTPAQAQVCQHVHDDQILLVINHKDWTTENEAALIPVGRITADLDVQERKVCFIFSGIKALETTVKPSHVCLDIDDDNDNPKVTVLLPSGEAVDVSGTYSVNAIRPWFDYRYKECLGHMGKMAEGLRP
jgi:hypothetical protein